MRNRASSRAPAPTRSADRGSRPSTSHPRASLARSSRPSCCPQGTMTCGTPDDAAARIDHILRPETQAALQNTQSATLEAAPDPEEFPLSAQWAQIREESAIYTIQDQAFPKAVADSYFALQSDVLQ